LEAPLSSFLRPGPAAPNNDQPQRDPHRDGQGGGDGTDGLSREAMAARRLPEDPALTRGADTRPEQRLAEARMAENRIAEARSPADYISPSPDTLASARAAANQAARPVERMEPRIESRNDPRPASAGNLDQEAILAGLEAAALRDIGESLNDQARAAPQARSRAASDVDDAAGGADDDKAERRARREARRNRAGADDSEAGDDGASSKRARNDTDEKADRHERKLKRQEAKGKARGESLPATTTGRAVEKKQEKALRKREKEPKTSSAAPREWGIPWTALSFFLMVIIPSAICAFYYLVIASPQYQVETQFAVRGSSQSSMATMGIGSILGGTTSQSSDSYIVTSYVESLQLVRDVQEQLGIDLRQFYTRAHIDWLYRIDPDMPLEKFTEYWRSMTDVSYNATTGNTTLLVYGFSAEDSKAIADAVLKVSERLVNQLSESNRQQVMQVASKQVDRAEERLRKVQGEIRKLRVEEKITDPATLIQLQNQTISTLRGQLSALKTRYSALLKSVSAEAPQAKSLMKQIDAMEAQIVEQEAQLGSSDGDNGKKMSPEEKANLAEVLNKFEELTIEQTFATQAYTTALAAFETAIVEAQRQERYFATFVAPTRPEIALYPMRYLDSFIAFLVLLAIWMTTQFIYRSFRDHAI
jgi:capsular polysaccharide transport system permease protein